MTTATERYNGWANYATWRVNLEVFDGYDPDGVYQTGESVETYVADWMDSQIPPEGSGNILSGWVNAFLADVDWQEIADAINSDSDLTDPDTVTDDDGQDRESYSDTQDRDSYTA